jgi:hypothetical protein
MIRSHDDFAFCRYYDLSSLILGSLTRLAIPVGQGISLILNAIFLAGKINKETALTLPDIYAKRYGKTVEVMVSLTTITSFIMLLAGNMVGMGFIVAYCWGISQTAGIMLSAAIVWAYTVSGGLYSVAYTDVPQGVIGWSGCIIAAYWLIVNADESAPPPSIGFEGYIYPNDEICQQYQGVPCTNDPTLCCYNMDKWCDANGENCLADVSDSVSMERMHDGKDAFVFCSFSFLSPYI